MGYLWQSILVFLLSGYTDVVCAVVTVQQVWPPYQQSAMSLFYILGQLTTTDPLYPHPLAVHVLVFAHVCRWLRMISWGMCSNHNIFQLCFFLLVSVNNSLPHSYLGGYVSLRFCPITVTAVPPASSLASFLQLPKVWQFRSLLNSNSGSHPDWHFFSTWKSYLCYWHAFFFFSKEAMAKWKSSLKVIRCCSSADKKLKVYHLAWCLFCCLVLENICKCSALTRVGQVDKWERMH